jgi:hypothetical protein
LVWSFCIGFVVWEFLFWKKRLEKFFCLYGQFVYVLLQRYPDLSMRSCRFLPLQNVLQGGNFAGSDNNNRLNHNIQKTNQIKIDST